MPTYKHEQQDEKTAIINQDRVVGGIPYVYNRVPVNPIVNTMPEPPVLYSIDTLVIDGVLAQLNYTATVNSGRLGPTRASRLNYIFMASVATAFNWINGPGYVTGIHDNWNWDIHSPLPDIKQQYVWMNHCLIAILPVCIPSYDVSSWLSAERTLFGWTVQQQNDYWAAVQVAGNFSAWYGLWTTWRNDRMNNDNYTAANAALPLANTPNRSSSLTVPTYLNTAAVTNFGDTSAYQDNTKWTALQIGAAQQGYLTWNWYSIRTTCVSDADNASVVAAAAPYFASTSVARLADINALVSVVTTLDDNKKVQAEFWAGGPYTGSPPGMFIYLWAMHAKATGYAQTVGNASLIFSGLELATQLFEMGRIVWQIKANYMEGRPIQDIRRLIGGNLIAYDGVSKPANLWMPFQTANFVTPPFADFPSGHSAFSQSFANVMTKWFGPNIPNNTVSYSNLGILCPMFTTNQTMPYGSFTTAAGTSEIQPGVVPAAPLTLSWSTWQSMANSAGLSRQYGGIHCISADLGSKAAANALTPIVQAAWGF
jgi:hypothetical protein